MGANRVPPRPTPAARSPNGGPESSDPRRALGRRGEDLAADHLRRLGFSTLARNVRTRAGEIDLIGFDGHTIVFAEVKTLRVSARGAPAGQDRQPLLWLRRPQRARLRRLAIAWLSDEGRVRPTARAIRFDAIGVTVDPAEHLVDLEHIENAW